MLFENQHTTKPSFSEDFDFKIPVNLKGQRILLFVKLRPFLIEFLKSVRNFYNIYIWGDCEKDIV